MTLEQNFASAIQHLIDESKKNPNIYIYLFIDLEDGQITITNNPIPLYRNRVFAIAHSGAIQSRKTILPIIQKSEIIKTDAETTKETEG